MKKFEYRLLEVNRSFFSGIDSPELTEHLNLLGTQGWEVVSTVALTSGGSTASLLITLKREIA
ncbi:DUF4177 domain-containing protein [Hymenobacter coccineus]|uniref:DUF4177 domain-containing protein n=1 Tax=Hymenobacter coccineus TaxID=1908235 RepID=A0A1G1TD74_9BACT|nr:DUF4177 domain-containing protein [Hymenobacter coccineus]OGX88822.1 hypothetical protein BEN49_10035 [Hymenobacter coccineus]